MPTCLASRRLDVPLFKFSGDAAQGVNTEGTDPLYMGIDNFRLVVGVLDLSVASDNASGGGVGIAQTLNLAARLVGFFFG